MPFTAQHYDTHYNVFFTAPVVTRHRLELRFPLVALTLMVFHRCVSSVAEFAEFLEVCSHTCVIVGSITGDELIIMA